MTTEETTTGKRIVFTHADIVTMTRTYAHGGRQAVYKAFPNVHNDIMDAKMIELGIMEKPQRPALPDEQKRSVAGQVIEVINSTVPHEHQTEAARAVMLALRDRFLPKKGPTPK